MECRAGSRVVCRLAHPRTACRRKKKEKGLRMEGSESTVYVVSDFVLGLAR